LHLATLICQLRKISLAIKSHIVLGVAASRGKVANYRLIIGRVERGIAKWLLLTIQIYKPQ